MYKGKRLTVIVAAGGSGSRFGADGPKQFLELGGESMLIAAARPFLRGGHTDMVVFVVPEAYMALCGDLLEDGLGAVRPSPRENGAYGGRLSLALDGREIALRIVAGGADRAASVRAGLEAAADGGADGLVLIHDAARPFVSAELIERVLAAAYSFGAAAPAIAMRDTVYAAELTAEGYFAAEIPEREGLRAVQTPQGFDLALIKGAHEYALSEGLAVTDDGTPVFAGGGRVTLVEGDPANIKITLPEDMPERRSLAALREGGDLRVGMGFDVHRFEPGRALVLGGLAIPFEKGLAGHSDADVLTHALMDAILGALREGDIGKLFPDTDPAYAGISSILLLKEVVSLMARRGYAVVNADMTIVAERPRMAPYRGDIERLIAEALGTAPENISLKATTTEKLGFTGREQGIGAEAVVLLGKTQAGRV